MFMGLCTLFTSINIIPVHQRVHLTCTEYYSEHNGRVRVYHANHCAAKIQYFPNPSTALVSLYESCHHYL